MAEDSTGSLKNPWTNVYGLARTLLASGTILTLLWNDSVTLFSPAARGVVDDGSLMVRLTFFSLLREHLELARILAVLALIVVASGWRPRFTGLVHWWIAWSFQMVCIPADGGDQVAGVLTLLLVPLTLSDSRKWHWDAAPRIDSGSKLLLSRVGLSSLLVIRVQVAAIYLHAGVAKLNVPEWLNGTALYYWLLDPRIGLPTRYHDWVLALLRPDLSVALLTWAPVALELCLFLVLAMPSNHVLRKPLFALGLVFHLFNIVLFGLVSFCFSMCAALVMLAWPPEQPFSLNGLGERLARARIPRFGWSSYDRDATASPTYVSNSR